MSKRTLTAGEKRQKRKRNGKLQRQTRVANTRAKYGPLGKPSPVVVTTLDGTVVDEVDQSRFQQRAYAGALESAARDAGYASYAAYLRSPAWKMTREKVLERDGHKCSRCPAETTLQAHHRWYATLGAEPLDSMITLCRPCHKRTHGRSLRD